MDISGFAALSGISVPHILEKIFFSLDYESFKICMEVSNSWKKMLTTETFRRMGKSVFCKNIKLELYQALRDGNLKDVRSILSSSMADVNCIWGHHDATSLGVASLKGHKLVAQLLLDSGAEPNKANNLGQTPLLLAQEKGHMDIVTILNDALNRM